jgi:hypothetical protein
MPSHTQFVTHGRPPFGMRAVSGLQQAEGAPEGDPGGSPARSRPDSPAASRSPLPAGVTAQIWTAIPLPLVSVKTGRSYAGSPEGERRIAAARRELRRCAAVPTERQDSVSDSLTCSSVSQFVAKKSIDL